MSSNDPGLPPQPAETARTDTRTDADTDVTAVQHRWITEDWLATATGLALLLLLLTGILPKGWLL